jgi:hypothetical protein
MIRGEATATLSDGRTLTLAMGFRALALASAASGIPASELFAVMQKDDGRQMLALLALIHGALNKYHRDIGTDEVDDLMLTDSEVLSTALGDAMNGAFSPADDSKADEGNAPNGTSTPLKRTGRKQG